jgi:phage terminase small subunit
VADRLTAREQRFVDEYLVDLNATKAAIRAGYSARTAASQASRLLRNVKVQEAIAAGKERLSERAEIEAIEVIRELACIGRSDIGRAFDKQGQLLPLHEMPEDMRRAIASVEVEMVGGGTKTTDDGMEINVPPVAQVTKLKLWDKNKALEMLGRWKKLFTDKVELEGKVKHSHEDALAELE